jgi:hypothetical protein
MPSVVAAFQTIFSHFKSNRGPSPASRVRHPQFQPPRPQRFMRCDVSQWYHSRVRSFKDWKERKEKGWATSPRTMRITINVLIAFMVYSIFLGLVTFSVDYGQVFGRGAGLLILGFLVIGYPLVIFFGPKNSGFSRPRVGTTDCCSRRRCTTAYPQKNPKEKD